MFRQSIVYLYNGYREDGLNTKEAKAQVVKDIEEVYGEYSLNGNMPELKSSISNPKVRIDDMIKQVSSIDWTSLESLPTKRKEEELKRIIYSTSRNLHHLRSLYK